MMIERVNADGRRGLIWNNDNLNVGAWYRSGDVDRIRIGPA
jgi:hypothetical protein